MNCAGFPGKRIFAGDRPTGRLHLGHWTGSLENRVSLQDIYECFFLIGDLQVLAAHRDDAEMLARNIRHVVLDYLSVGIDPERSVIYLESLVPEAAELSVLLGTLVDVSRLQQAPFLQDVRWRRRSAFLSLGLLSSPVLLAAAMLSVRADLVPAGEDEESHIELARELAGRFNERYRSIFPLPDQLRGKVPLLPGIDGAATMDTALDNAIYLSDDPATVAAKVNRMGTGRGCGRAPSPQHGNGNPLFTYHDAFNPRKAEVAELKEGYREGRAGEGEAKQRLIGALNDFLDPLRERRARYAQHKDLVEEIVLQGSAVAREQARLTLELVKDAMGLAFFTA